MNGVYSPKIGSKVFQTDWALKWWEALLLFGSGVLAVVLHRAYDLSLGLPGHHGLEWMALLVMGRAASRFRGAGSLTSIGASLASTLPFLQGENPFTWLFYLLPGLFMDFAFAIFPEVTRRVWFLMLLGGLAHMTKPVGQLLFNLATGWPFGSFRYGILYPFASHLFFGMIGGLIGALIVLGVNRLSSNSKSA